VSVVASAAPAGAEEHKKEEGKKEEGHQGGHEGRLPVSYTERPITLPRLILNPELEFAFERVAFGGVAPQNIAIGLSARFGITDDLDAYAIFAPLEIGPFGDAAIGGAGFHYVNPKIGATYRFIHKEKLEIGATLGLAIVTHVSEGVGVPIPEDKAGVVIEPGAVAKLHISKEMSLEAAAYVPLEIGTLTGAGLRVPLAFAYDITEPFHVGVRSGVGILNFAPDKGAIGDGVYVPLGVFAGYAVGGKDGPILDIDPFFTWPALFTPANTAAPGLKGTSHVNGGYISVGLSLGGFIYL
jgi:hypothetical protein